MQRGSVWRDPRKLPVPVPDTGIFDTPTVRICVNSKWVSHIDGVLGRLLEPDAWIGTESEVEAAIQQVLELQALLDEMGNCDVCDDLEFRISEGHLEWNCNGAGWTDLGVVVGADGADGADGDDGREIELQKSATHIQWRYVGETSWTNLVALADIKGDPGDDATIPALPVRAEMWHETSLVLTGNALAPGVQTSQEHNIQTFQNTAADGDSFTNSFWIRAGTYTLRLLGVTGNNRGKVDWYIDGSLVASGQDWYSASTTFNVVKTVTSLTLTDGKHTLKGVVNGKNVSSASYFIVLTRMDFVPSAD